MSYDHQQYAKQLFTKHKLSPASKVVLVILADRIPKKTSWCRISFPELARGTGLAVPTVHRAINELVDKGIILRTSGSSREKNHYVMALPSGFMPNDYSYLKQLEKGNYMTQKETADVLLRALEQIGYLPDGAGVTIDNDTREFFYGQ